MYISEKHQIRSSKNKDGTVTYILMEKIHGGTYKQTDSIITDKPEMAMIHFRKTVGQLP
jgi:hypothetical protein